MPFGVVSRAWYGVLDFGGDRRRKGSFGGEESIPSNYGAHSLTFSSICKLQDSLQCVMRVAIIRTVDL